MKNEIQNLMWQAYWQGYKQAYDVEFYDAVGKRAARSQFNKWWNMNYK